MIPKLSRREIDRDFYLVWPICRVETGLADHPFAERNDKAGLFGNRNELRGRDRSALRLVPAQETLPPDNPMVFDIEDWLVEQLKFTPGDSISQIRFQSAPACNSGKHSGLEKSVDASPICLGPVQGHVGSLHQLGRSDRFFRSTSNPNADIHGGLQATNVVRRLDRCANSIRQAEGIFRALDLDVNYRKFITAQAGDSIPFFDAITQPVGDGFQQLVADQMPERIIHVLEVVQVQEKHRQSRSLRDRSKPLLELIGKSGAVEQAG